MAVAALVRVGTFATFAPLTIRAAPAHLLIAGSLRCRRAASGVLRSLRRGKVAVENKRVQVEPLGQMIVSTVQGDFGEIIGILQGCEFWSPEMAGQINRTFDAVIEARRRPYGRTTVTEVTRGRATVRNGVPVRHNMARRPRRKFDARPNSGGVRWPISRPQ